MHWLNPLCTPSSLVKSLLDNCCAQKLYYRQHAPAGKKAHAHCCCTRYAGARTHTQGTSQDSSKGWAQYAHIAVPRERLGKTWRKERLGNNLKSLPCTSSNPNYYSVAAVLHISRHSISSWPCRMSKEHLLCCAAVAASAAYPVTTAPFLMRNSSLAQRHCCMRCTRQEPQTPEAPYAIPHRPFKPRWSQQNSAQQHTQHSPEHAGRLSLRQQRTAC